MKTLKSISIVTAWALSLYLVLALGARASHAQQVISYQGVVTQNSTPLSGTHNVTISIYPSATGGTAIYTENQSVAFTSGLFNVLIGSVTPLPMLMWNSQYFLDVAIDGTEITTRSQLGSAPTAWSSRFADSARVAGSGASAGGVTTLNTLSGAVTLSGGGGTTINQSGQTITISSSGGGGTGIQGIQNTDGTINITSPNGPTATIGLADNAVTTAKLANNSVTTAKIVTGAVTNAVVGSGSATNGQILTANGSGGAAWVTPAAFTLPYSQSLSSGSNLFSLTNTGAGSALAGTASSGSGTPAVVGNTTNATGIGVLGVTSDGGSGVNPNAAVCGTTLGGFGIAGSASTGIGVEAYASSTGTAIHAILGSGATTAQAGLFENTAVTTTGNLLEARCMGTGEAGYFHIDNAASTANALQVSTLGTGGALYATCAGTGAPAAIVGEATAAGANNSTGVWGKCDETGAAGIGVYGSNAGGGVGVYGNSTSGVGVEAITGGAGNALVAQTGGTGYAIKALSTSTTNTTPTILAQSSSINPSVFCIQGEITSSFPAGNSTGVRGINDGTGSDGIGVWGSHAGSGWGVFGEVVSGRGVFGLATGGGTGVLAEASSSSAGGNALIAEIDGSAASSTTANNCAIFRSGSTNVARIDRTGKGFFDGGTQSSGADVAEEFDVAGARSSYSPGDVLVISTTGDRQVEKCITPYSRLVVGVYATKPGVTLTDMDIDADESARVPMGVIGVLPTKVTTEGGAITAGDLLVTSSTPGCAMKADLKKLQIGQALGKALENFSGHGTGVIKVLVGKY